MSSDFEGYEQDFAVLTAEITSKIGRVPKLSPAPAGTARISVSAPPAQLQRLYVAPVTKVHSPRTSWP